MRKNIMVAALSSLITFLLTTTWMLSLSASGTNDLARLNEIKTLVEKHYLYDADSEKMMESAAVGMALGTGDPYAYFFNQQQHNDMRQELDGKYFGIGVSVYVDPADRLMTVESVFDDTPAQNAGIIHGDKILSINSIAVTAENFQDMVSYLQGQSEEGKTVDTFEIALARSGAAEVLRLTLERAEINQQTVSTIEYDDVLYIRISKFGNNTGAELREKIDGINREKTRAVVLDLRDNPGGSFPSAREVADILTPNECLLVYSENKQGKRVDYRGRITGFDLPLAVLCNGNSASGSEVVIGALKDNAAATIIGTKTFGKGVVQTIYELHDKSALKLTTDKYYTPGGVCIQEIGIQPDIVSELPEELAKTPINRIDFNADTQLQAALEVVRK